MSAHPAAGARPGETIAIGPGYRWLAYSVEGAVVAACYTEGRLLRRDLAGWWVAGLCGQRQPVPDRTVAALLGTVPPGWSVLPEQVPLLGAAVIRRQVAS